MTKADSDTAQRTARAGRAAATRKARAGDPSAAITQAPSRAAPDVLAGLNKATLDKLMRLGIASTFDLVLHLPLRYIDETRIHAINDAPSAQEVLVEGRVVEASVKYRPRRQLVSHIEDGSGVLTLRFFNFYPSQLKQLAPGARVRAFGEIRHGFFGPEMVHPKIKTVREEAPLPQALTPIYPTTAGLAQEALRQLISRAVAASGLTDTLPEALLAKLRLPRFAEAVRFLHNPPPQVSHEDLHTREHPAWRRVKFDELLAQQLSMRIHYRRRKSAEAAALPPLRTLTRRLLATLPFALTRAQQKALSQIEHDLAQPYPMQRLLQGDVGSGKTIVAALAALQAVESGAQVAVMAPTEILAEQHYHKFASWLEPLDVTVTWLGGGLRKRDKAHVLNEVESGRTQIAVGTHALFQEQVCFANLALAIVDEQHRFGVHQRLALRMKGARGSHPTQPHQLMMSATPIPRTLAMSYYADLDVSVIDELPPGRTPVATKLVADTRRTEVIQRVRDACMAGSQAYWVCPLIEESADSGTARAPAATKGVGRDTLQLKTVLETYETVRAAFPELKVGLVHGRLKSEDKAAVMKAFQNAEIQLLVATTVIEVGVDVPNATLMVIEHAERMGLSQLHQLRGRVGRGAGSSTCILLYQNPLTPTARERLKIIYENGDGFEVARHDLRLRGPGELLGARQSGVPMLRFADLNEDLDLLDSARDVAEQFLRGNLRSAQSHLSRWLGEKHELLEV